MTSSRARLIPIVLAGVFAGSPARSQEPPAASTKLWAGSVELSYVATSGNTDTQTLGTAGELAYKPAPWSLLAKAAYVRSESDGVEKARSLEASLRGARALSARLEAYAQAGYLRNTFAGLERRLTADAGAAYKLLDLPTYLLKLDGGAGYATERRVRGRDDSYPVARAGLYFLWKPWKTTELTEELAFVPNLEDSDDWQLKRVTAVAVKMTSVLALKVSYTVQRDNQPVPGFQKKDTITAASLVAKF